MKNLIYILSVMCLALSSCGTTDPWKDWENEGKMGSDRLKPSELKKTLCAADGWKITYKGVDFYFQFDGAGNGISETNEMILEDKVESKYRLDFDGAKILLLTLPDAGALKYLPEGVETTFRISSYNDNRITATTKKTKTPVIFNRITAEDLARNAQVKHEALLAKKKAEFIERLKKELYNGVIRDADKKFLAHYSILGEDLSRIKISVLRNRVLTHYESDLTISTDEENGIVTFDVVTVNNIPTTQLRFALTSSEMRTDSQLQVETNEQARAYYIEEEGEFKKKSYALNYLNNLGAASAEIWQELNWANMGKLEINGRPFRPLIFSPGSAQPKISYVGYHSNYQLSEEIDRIYFNKGEITMITGAANKDELVALVEANCPNTLAAWFHEDGWYMTFGENKNTFYLISPTTNNWIMGAR